MHELPGDRGGELAMLTSGSCAVCWNRLDSAPVHCESCGTGYHAECLRIVGPCPVSGCPAGQAVSVSGGPAGSLPARARGTPERYRESLARLRTNAPVIAPLIALQAFGLVAFLVALGPMEPLLIVWQLIAMLAIFWSTALAANPAHRPSGLAALVWTPLRQAPRILWAAARMWLAVAAPVILALSLPAAMAPLSMAAMACAFFAMLRLHLVPFLAILPAETGGRDPVAESWRLTGSCPGMIVRGHLGFWLGAVPVQLLSLAFIVLGSGPVSGMLGLLLWAATNTALQAFAATFTVVLLEDCRRALSLEARARPHELEASPPDR